jgi:hypothetical protein
MTIRDWRLLHMLFDTFFLSFLFTFFFWLCLCCCFKLWWDVTSVEKVLYSIKQILILNLFHFRWRERSHKFLLLLNFHHHSCSLPLQPFILIFFLFFILSHVSDSILFSLLSLHCCIVIWFLLRKVHWIIKYLTDIILTLLNVPLCIESLLVFHLLFNVL